MTHFRACSTVTIIVTFLMSFATAEDCPDFNVTSVDEVNSRCKKNENSPICENRGVCDCGVCKCYQRPSAKYLISGQFCECDNYNCPRHDGKLCSGHGYCVCAKCLCQEAWTGDACECKTSPDSCLAPNGMICNGRGTCQCGICKCSPEFGYTGPTCDICPTCPSQCSQMEPCVLCRHFMKGEKTEEECDTTCSGYDITVNQEYFDANIDQLTICEFMDTSDNCTFVFGYNTSHGSKPGDIDIFVQREKICYPPEVTISSSSGKRSEVVLAVLLLFYFSFTLLFYI